MDFKLMFTKFVQKHEVTKVNTIHGLSFDYNKSPNVQ